MGRNLSMQRYFVEKGEKHKPQYRFSGRTKIDWRKWKAALLPAVKATLGLMPARVPLRPAIEAEWQEHGLIKQRLVFDVEEGLSARAFVFRPANARGRLPAILCCHGHGANGKDPIMGNTGTEEMIAQIRLNNYDYGLQMAKAGFVTIAIDWRGFGERDDRRKPNHCNVTDGRKDMCDAVNNRALTLGMTALGMDVSDGMCALDYLCSQKYVDGSRIGAMGLSFGGTMTAWMSICDERVKAADVMCYSDRFADFGLRDNNYCGSQITPGLFALCDVPDLQGLIAPRPLLVEIGTYDKCFLLESSMSCYREVEKIFTAAGCREKLELDLFEGGHRWGGNKSVAFFRKHLGV